jgi:hypothetical protein
VINRVVSLWKIDDMNQDNILYMIRGSLDDHDHKKILTTDRCFNHV